MSTSAGTLGQDMDRKVLYTVYCAPDGDRLQILKQSSIFSRYHNLSAGLYVEGTEKFCDLEKEANLRFTAVENSDVQIAVYAKRRKRLDCIAKKTCKLASLISTSGTRVQLDIIDPRARGPPILLLRATVEAFGSTMCEEAGAFSSSIEFSDKWNTMEKYARRLIKVGTIIGEAHPVAKAIFAGLDVGLKELHQRKEFNDDILSLIVEISRSCKIVLESDTQQCKKRREKQVAACNALVPEIFGALSYIRVLASKKTVSRLRSKVNEEVSMLRKRLSEGADIVEGARQIDTQSAVFRIENLVTDVKDIAIELSIDSKLRHLKVAKDMQPASARECLPNTRVQLLETIMHWALDSTGIRSFLLYGTAGQGKSAVAHSVARQLGEMGFTVAFFAFDRVIHELSASQLFPTISKKLASRDPHYLKQLLALPVDLLETTDIADQCELLFLSCLRNHVVSKPTLIIIDALDECPNDSEDSMDRREELLRALKKCISNDLHYRIRFLVTTRLESDIQDTFSDDSLLTRLHCIDTNADTNTDIRKFVASKLVTAPNIAYVDLVTEAAQRHFECAAILCRELKNHGKPMSSTNRSRLIERIRSRPGHSLYGMYRFILETHLDKTDEGCLSVYRQLLVWVLAVRQPQSRAVFQEIATVLLPAEDVMAVLEGLGSLLTGTAAGAGEPVRPLHTSFRDYVLDAEASGAFAITLDLDSADSQLAYACFRIMARGLRYNTCNLPSPLANKKDVVDLSDHITQHVSPGLQYACREISEHLLRCHEHDRAPDLASALKMFMQAHFLLWLEACGWLGYEPCDSLRDMLRWVKKHSQYDLVSVILDFIAFEKRFREAIVTSPPHAHITGLLFAPVNSHVSRLYRPRVTGPIEVSGYDQEREWPPNETLVIQVGTEVKSVAYSHDGTKIIAVLDDSTLLLLDAETGRQISVTTSRPEFTVTSVAFSPDGSSIASGSWGPTVLLWDIKTGQQKGEELRGHPTFVPSVTLSPDGATVVHGGTNNYAPRFWGTPEGYRYCVDSVVFSHNGSLIVSGARDGSVRIWDTATQQQLGSPLLGHENSVISVAISRNDASIASGSCDGTVCVWDIEGGQLISTWHGHAGCVYAVAFSPDDDTRIVTVTGERTDTVITRIWDATSGKQVGDDLRSHSPGHCVYSAALSPDGQHVASGSYDCTIRVWDVREAKKRTDTAVEHTSAITSISCSSDGKYIVSGSQDKTVQLWDAQMGYAVGEPMMGHDAVVNCVSFSPDNTRVASASNDMTVRVWDVQARLPVSVELCGHDSSVYCVAFSPDGTCLVSGSADRTLRIWDLAAGQQLGDALHGHEERVRSVSFSSDGFSIASGSDDGTVRLWDARTQLQRGDALKGHVHWVWSVAFSHDGACLVSASSDQKIRLWDAYTGKQMGEPLTGHTDWVRFVSLSPDGKYVVSGSDDRTVRVWNVQTRQQVGDALRGHEKLVMSAAFSPDGTRIVSGCHDGTIRIWDFENLRRQENLVDVVNTSSTGLRKQETFLKEQKDLWNGWMVCEGYDGSEQPLLWIPHHLRHYHRITSPYQIQFVPPVPHIRITLSDSFRINEWPTYTPEPA